MGVRYDGRRPALEAAEALAPVRTAADLARRWAEGLAAVGVRHPGGVRASRRFLEEAGEVIAWCRRERVDPARLVAALFDHARVQTRRRGRRWRPSIRQARSAFALGLARAHEARELEAAGSPGAAVAAARRRSAPPPAPAPPPRRERTRRAPVFPGPGSARALAWLRDRADEDAARLSAALAASPGLSPDAALELDPARYSPVLRAAAGCPLPGDRASDAWRWLAAEPAASAARRRLVAAGVPPSLLS